MEIKNVNFKNNEIKYIEHEGKNYICLKDVGRVLGISNTNDTAKRIDDSTKIMIQVDYIVAYDSLQNPVTRAINTTFVNQDGLEMFLKTSRKTDAPLLLDYLKYNSGLWDNNGIQLAKIEDGINI